MADTEDRNCDSIALDQMSCEEIARPMNREDQRMVKAVEAVLEKVAAAAQMTEEAADASGSVGISDSAVAAEEAVLSDSASASPVSEPRRVVHGETVLCAMPDDENSLVIENETNVHTYPSDENSYVIRNEAGARAPLNGENSYVIRDEANVHARPTDENSHVIRDEAGIHARPAGALVNLAKRFDAQIYLTANGRTARADGILEIMSLGAAKGTRVSVSAEGNQREEALNAVVKFLKETL